MIVEFFTGLGVNIAIWLASFFPTDWEVPEFLLTFDQTVNGLLAMLTGVSVWVDWTVAITCVSVVMATWVIALGVKVVRALIAHVPQFGGAG